VTGHVEYVLQCGRMYLGEGSSTRVSDPSRAKRFQSRETAETKAVELRGGDKPFPLPWAVETAVPHG